MQIQFWPVENFGIFGSYEYLSLDEIKDKSTGQILANFPDKSEKWFGTFRWIVTPKIWATFEYHLTRTDRENPSSGLDDDGDVQTIQVGIYWFF